MINLARLSRLLPAAALGLALTGCVNLGGAEPAKVMIGLSADAAPPAGTLAGGPVADALVVLDPVADRRLDVPRVAVQVDDARVAYLVDAAWVERPQRQLRRLIAETVRAGGKRLVFEGIEGEGRARSVLSGRLVDMGYDARGSAVVVRYDAVLSDGGGAVRSQRFEARVPGVKPKAKYVAPALNKAANDVARQVADWVG